MQRLMFTGKLINRCNMSIIEKLKKLLSEVPPKWNQIRNIMDSNTLTKEDLATLAISLADDCFCEYTDALDPEIKGLDADNMCSDYLIEGLFFASGIWTGSKHSCK